MYNRQHVKLPLQNQGQHECSLTNTLRTPPFIQSPRKKTSVNSQLLLISSFRRGANWYQLFLTSLIGLLSNSPCLGNLPCSCIQTIQTMDYCEHSRCVPTSKSCFFCFLPTPFHIPLHLPKSCPSLKTPSAIPITRIQPSPVFLYLQFTLPTAFTLILPHISLMHTSKYVS